MTSQQNGRSAPRLDQAVGYDEELDESQPAHAGSGEHGPTMAGYLLINGIMAPALLSQPFVFAVMSWGGAIAVNLIMALASWYCMFHQAQLFHYGGGRHSTYKRMGNAVLGPYMGRWGGLLIAGLQYFINVGSTITNMILAGQLLQSVYTNLCTDKARCTLTGTSAWIGISGAVSYAIYMGVPDMSSMAWASICGTVFAIYYSVAGMVLAALDGNAATASYDITGSASDRVFNALNGVGMLLFLYGVTVLPEIQDVLRPHRKTGNTSRSMIWAATAAHCVFVPLYLLVGAIGYWAYGAKVDPFLLFATTWPTGVVVSAELAAAVQIQLVSQVMMLPVFEAVERVIIRRFPSTGWLVTRNQSQQEQQPAREAAAAAQPAVTWPLSRAATEEAPSRMASLASHMSDMARTLSSIVPHSSDQDGTHGLTATPPHMQKQQSASGAAQRAGSAGPGLHEVRCVGSDAVISVSTGAAAAGTDAAAAAGQVGLQGGPAVPPALRHHASLPLMVASRTVITGLLLFVACALPFFSGIMGFFGAVGFGPITYALPTIMYMVAFKDQMSWQQRWFDTAFIAFWLLASLAGAIGALYSIVTTASTYHFFS